MLVPEDARPALEPVRHAFDPATVARGIPLHITLLYPFVGRDEIDDDLFGVLTALFARCPPLQFALTEVREWPGVAWAAPEPAEPIVSLSRAIWESFPNHSPYDGEFGEPTPHATLAEKAGVATAVRARCARLLPIDCTVREVTLLAERAPGQWEALHRFALG